MKEFFMSKEGSEIYPEDLHHGISELFAKPKYSHERTHRNMLTLPNGYSIYDAIKKYQALGFNKVTVKPTRQEWLERPGIEERADGHLYFNDFPIALATQHGSKLYGMDNAGSDDDWYLVLDDSMSSRRALSKQRKSGDDDRMLISMQQFIELIAEGSHQALEAKFSPFAYKAPVPYEAMINKTIPSNVGVGHKYRSAAKSFMASGIEENSEKKIKHSVRLSADYGDYLAQDKIQPLKTPNQRRIIEQIASEIIKAYK